MFFCGTGIAGYKYTADLTHVIVDDADIRYTDPH